jgi:CelD/BcsL family acetyltransferase involved in cellulose biosynthesis
VREIVHNSIRRNPEWDVCDFQELRPCSLLFEHTARAQATVCPVLSLEDTMEAQLARADASLRRSLRTAAKRLSAAGRVEFIRADRHNCEALLDRLFELHSGRWHERGESGMFSTAALRAFYGEVAHQFSEAGMLRLYGLLVNGECIAVQFNFAAKGRVYAYQAGFDPIWSRSSPGSVGLAHSIEDAIRERDREFDFLLHAEDFKYAWGARDTYVYRFVIARRSV